MGVYDIIWGDPDMGMGCCMAEGLSLVLMDRIFDPGDFPINWDLEHSRKLYRDVTCCGFSAGNLE